MCISLILQASHNIYVKADIGALFMSVMAYSKSIHLDASEKANCASCQCLVLWKKLMINQNATVTVKG